MENAQNKTQIYKFGFYGLLKNLKFFEPFLWLYFLVNGLSFLEIGLLYSVREVIVYVFEIPSGVFADRFGKKNELVLCFVFYIISFIVFYFSNNFYLFALAMALYGFGEAFRSGTHKAMIMQFLDVNKMKESKTQIYGLTRSYSNIGSAISSIGGVVLVLFTPDLSYLFLIAIIPYIVDLLLILSYPEYLNNKVDTEFKIKDFLVENVRSVKYAFTTPNLNRTIIQSSGFNAIFKTIKDYIQPIIIGLGITILLFGNFSLDDNLKIIIGLIYASAQIISVFVTRNAYKLEKRFEGSLIISSMWLFTAITCILLGIFINNVYIVMVSFILFYVFLNTRKPFMVEKIGNQSDNTKRASVLSIESQITSLFIIIFAPVLGYISDTFNIGIMMIALGVFMMISQLIFPKEKSA